MQVPFGIEENKDELYIGSGLAFTFDQFDGADSTTTPVDKFFFDGRIQTQQTFTLFSDTAWVYFVTDKNNDDMIFEGFRLTWATPDTTAPVVSCINDVFQSVGSSSTGTNVAWTEPTATDDSGSVAQTRSVVPGSFFSVGTTLVTYTFSDPSGNSASCSFNVRVLVGKIIARFRLDFGNGGNWPLQTQSVLRKKDPFYNPHTQW